MAGVKRFCDEAVLDRAADVFWRKGFDATSIQDLETATGLGRGSLYNAFGDKQALFLKVLARYGETQSPPLQLLNEPDVFIGLRQMLRGHVANMDAPGRPRGCLFTNTCLTAGVDDASSIEARVANALRLLELTLEAAFVRAKSQGQLASSAVPLRLARFYSAILQSLGVMHKAFGDRATLDDVVDVALTAWPAAHPISLEVTS